VQGRLRRTRAVAARWVRGTMSSPLPTFQSKTHRVKSKEINHW
jgi:hypothetical protein